MRDVGTKSLFLRKRKPASKRCGFFVFRNKGNLFPFVEENKKPAHGVRVVFMVAKDNLLGSQAKCVIPYNCL
jgi:hypothetical protein